MFNGASVGLRLICSGDALGESHNRYAKTRSGAALNEIPSLEANSVDGIKIPFETEASRPRIST